MKGYKWYWTPRAWYLAIILIGLLVGAIFTEGVIQTILLILFCLTLLIGYYRTHRNIKRINQKVEDDKIKTVQDIDKASEEYFKREYEKQQTIKEHNGEADNG